MIKRLVEFLQNNFPNTNINDYLDSKFIELNSEQLKKLQMPLKMANFQSNLLHRVPQINLFSSLELLLFSSIEILQILIKNTMLNLHGKLIFLLFTQPEVRPRVSTLLVFHLMMILISHLHQPIRSLKIR